MSKEFYKYPLNTRYVQKAAEREGFDFEIIDQHAGFLVQVSFQGRSVFIGSAGVSGYPINNASACGVARDKAYTYNILKSASIAIPKTDYFFVDDKYADYRPDGKGVEEAIKFAAEIGYPVFVKPNDLSRGELAQSVSTEEALIAHLKCIAEKSYIGLIQEYVVGAEQRIFFIDGTPIFSYFKSHPALLGDGIKTIAELLEDISAQRHRHGLSAVNLNDPILQEELKKNALTLNAILPEAQTIKYCQKKNVSCGGGVEKFSQEFTAWERELCTKTAQASGLLVCSIDIIHPEDGREPLVLELNSSPSLTSLEALGREELLMDIWTTVLREALPS